MMNIGIFLNASKEKGGSYQYCQTLLWALKKTGLKDNLIPLYPKKKDLGFFKTRHFLGKLYDKSLGYFWKFNIKAPFKFKNIDLIIYPIATTACYSQKIPYIVCIHDLQHRINPQFSEVSKKGEWQKREFLYKNSLAKATTIISESKTGKDYIRKFYNVASSKIEILPYACPPYINKKVKNSFIKSFRRKYQLPKNFIFYPACFWPHKNHQLIIKALSVLKKKGLKINAVFVGKKMKEWGEYKKIINLARRLRIKKQIKYLDYVNNKEIIALYRMAMCLVMPTFFGPSNIPPLEAFRLGCPVITSNIEGIREQVGRAAILIDPNNEKELAEAILKIYKQPRLRNRLRKAGYKKIRNWTFNDFSKKLKQIITKTEKEL